MKDFWVYSFGLKSERLYSPQLVTALIGKEEEAGTFLSFRRFNLNFNLSLNCTEVRILLYIAKYFITYKTYKCILKV